MYKIKNSVRLIIVIFATIIFLSAWGSVPIEPGDCNNSSSEPEAFCKNLPSKNCGLCTHTMSLVKCSKTETQNKDCYDVGY